MIADKDAMHETSNLFELKYVPNKELLKVLVGEVDAQLFEATQNMSQSSSQLHSNIYTAYTETRSILSVTGYSNPPADDNGKKTLNQTIK